MLAAFTLAAEVRAELLPTPEEVSDMKQAALAILAQKLMGPDGHPVSIALLAPTDATASKVGPTVSETLRTLIAGYGIENVHVRPNHLKSLTMLQLRKALKDNNVDIVMVPYLQNTSFDLYLYDRRTPYALYAHSQPLPEVAQLNLTAGSAAPLARVLLRRTLYRYVHDQYFELPREESSPFLEAEIPRWIASSESISKANRDNESRFYASVTLGAAVSVGVEQAMWNSNLLGLQLGYRPFSRVYFEAAARTFSYNALSGSVKYQFMGKDSPLRLSIGAGLAYVTDRKVWAQDQTAGIKDTSSFAVAGATLQFPVGDVYLVIDGDAFGSLNGKDFIFTIAPGLMVTF